MIVGEKADFPLSEQPDPCMELKHPRHDPRCSRLQHALQ
jgi:hypothetical protein